MITQYTIKYFSVHSIFNNVFSSFRYYFMQEGLTSILVQSELLPLDVAKVHVFSHVFV